MHTTPCPASAVLWYPPAQGLVTIRGHGTMVAPQWPLSAKGADTITSLSTTHSNGLTLLSNQTMLPTQKATEPPESPPTSGFFFLPLPLVLAGGFC